MSMSMNFAMKKPGKTYGLVVPKGAQKAKKKPIASVFGDVDSDEDLSVNAQIQRDSQAKMRQKKVQAEYDQALAEDSTVFDYDGVYDDMQDKKQKSAASRKQVEQDRKPKYIANIMKMADYKKREEERVKERVEAKARLKELEEFGETEKFVTNAYKKKLLEWQKLDAEDARQAAIEAHNDPTRKGNLDSFYLNLMHDNVSMGNMIDKPAEGGSAAAAATSRNAPNAADTDADGDGHDLGIAGGTHIQFDMEKRGQEEVAVAKRGGIKRTDGRAERRAREEKEKVVAAEREAKRLKRSNDEAAVQSARERYLARKAAAAAAAAGKK